VSATNRGSKRQEADYYPTPAWATEALLGWSRRAYGPDFEVLDPCAGDGAILRVAKARGFVVRRAIEIRPEMAPALHEVATSVTIGDALRLPKVSGVCIDWVITNPPYSLAREFIEAWRPLAHLAAFLLRLNFFGSKGRSAWLRGAGRPAHVLVLDRRPAFVAVCKGAKTIKGCGATYPLGTKGRCECGGSIADGTDSTEYAWFVWEREDVEHTKLDILEVK